MTESFNAAEDALSSKRAWYQQMQLEDQDYRCFYCFRRFGSTVFRDRTKGHRLATRVFGESVGFEPNRIRLQLNWDHLIPWDYSRNNQNRNFVAACHVCNGIKRDLIFDTEAEARLYVAQRWTEKGYW